MELKMNQILSTLQKHRILCLIIGLGLLWSIFQLISLTRYPEATCDEGFYARSAVRYVGGLSAKQSWPPAVGRSFFLPHSRFYWLVLGSALSLLGRHLLIARFVSLLSLMVLITSTYLLGKEAHSHKTGMWAAGLVSVAWLSLYSGHLSRPDMLAAGMATLVLALSQIIIKQDRLWRYLLLGMAIAFSIDLHFIVIHLAWSVTVLALVFLIRQRKYQAALLLLVGMVAGIVAVLWLHFGSDIPILLTRLAEDPLTMLANYVGTGEAGSTLLTQSLRMFGTFLSFWWQYYAWYPPFVAVPQAVLFLTGLIYALFSGRSHLRDIAVVLLLSQLSFMVINTRTGYTLLGYSLLWLPMYMVLGVSSILELANLQLRSGSVPAQWSLSSLLVLFAVLYSAIDFLLYIRTLQHNSYAQGIEQITGQLPMGSSILVPRLWWLGFPTDMTYLDEELLFPSGSGRWWNAVPDSRIERDARDELAQFEFAQDLTYEKAQEIISDKLRQLQPDYVAVDSVVGCMAVETEFSRALQDYIVSVCTFQGEVDPLNPMAPYGGPQRIYACSWQVP